MMSIMRLIFKKHMYICFPQLAQKLLFTLSYTDELFRIV